MGKFDLSKPMDFARLTQSTAAGALQQLTGATADQWDIEEAAYGHPDGQLVRFHIFKTNADYDAAVNKVEDTGGRRKIVFGFPYVDGQTTDDLGRKGESWAMDILIHGPNYKKAYDRLLKEFNDPRPGTLVHPVRGRLLAVVQDWSVTHASETRQAVAIRAVFIEHNFNVNFKRVDQSVKSALAGAIAFFAKIDNVLNKIDSNINVLQNVKNIASATISAYKDLFSSNLSRLNTTFNGGTSSDLPGLLPTNNGSFPTASAPQDQFASVPDSGTLTALSAQQAVEEVRKLRDSLNSSIATLAGANGGEGALIFRDEIMDLKQSSVAIQKVLELGLQSNKARILSYSVPRVMSLREVCFANGLSPDRATELELLNPTLLSTNYVDPGTVLKVPVQ